MRMFMMAAYNLEAFYLFTEKSSLKKIIINSKRLQLIAINNLELLKLAFDWLRFAIFGDNTLPLTPKIAKYHH